MPEDLKKIQTIIMAIQGVESKQKTDYLLGLDIIGIQDGVWATLDIAGDFSKDFVSMLSSDKKEKYIQMTKELIEAITWFSTKTGKIEIWWDN